MRTNEVDQGIALRQSGDLQRIENELFLFGYPRFYAFYELRRQPRGLTTIGPFLEFSKKVDP